MGMPKTKLALFLFLILSQLLFAAEILDNGWPILGITIMLMVILLASMNMMAQALNKPDLEAWVKIEVREMIIAGILTAIVGSFIVSNTNPLVLILTAGATTNYEDGISGFINEMIEIYSDAYEHILHMSHFLSLTAGLMISMNIPAWYFGVTESGAPATGYGSFLIPIAHAAGALSNGIYIYMIMKLLLDFFTKVSVLILPFGFMFRFIPYTRQMGNTIIALIIGGYILFPASLILVKDFHSMINVPHPKITPNEYKEMNVRIPGGAALEFICEQEVARSMFRLGELGLDIVVCIPVAIATLGVGWAPCKAAMENIVWPALSLTMMTYIDTVLILAQLGVGRNPDKIFEAIFRFMSDTTGLVLLAYIDAIVVGIITIVGTRSIATALGGEYYLGTLSRLI